MRSAVRWWLRGVCVVALLAMCHAAPAAAETAPARIAKAGEARAEATLHHVGNFLERRGKAASSSVSGFWHRMTGRIERLDERLRRRAS
jgi:hypothetical protein